MMYGTYEVGKFLLAVLAAVFGFALISGEVSQSTIFLLFSKPVSRTRLLLTKYAVGASILFVVALLGSIGLIISAAARDYPLGYLSITGVALSTVLLWLGSLSVLGVALFFSVVFRNVLTSAAATLLVVYLMFLGPEWFVRVLFWEEYNFLASTWQLIWWLTPTSHWSNMALYAGESLMITSFLICLGAAAVPLVAALWLFNRKAY
jgi:ABC-2 type transport system permease protein